VRLAAASASRRPELWNSDPRLAGASRCGSRMPNVLTARRTAAVNRLRGVSQNCRLRPGADRELVILATAASA
jgi:hypothetical protein